MVALSWGGGNSFYVFKSYLAGGRVATDYRKWRPKEMRTHPIHTHTHTHKDKKSPLH